MLPGPRDPGADPPVTAMVLDPNVRWIDGHRLIGGSPQRLMRLSVPGRAALDVAVCGTPAGGGAPQFVRRLSDAGILHPRPRPVAGEVRVTIVIPVKDRAGELEAALISLGTDHGTCQRVLVVDDGSVDAAAIASVAKRHGAAVVRLPDSRGPAAARNGGLRLVDTEFVAFLDSDCAVGAGWLRELMGHFDDPLVGAVAPRIRPWMTDALSRTALARYLSARSPLDMGPWPALVGSTGRVRYVPSAAVLVRVEAAGSGFDERLRYGEDVDLIWRMADAGWRVRYDPSVSVSHREPKRYGAMLRRRFQYGTSAAPLASRHPDRLAPLVASPALPLAFAGACVGARRTSLAATQWQLIRGYRGMRRASIPVRPAVSMSIQGAAQQTLGIGRYLAAVGIPVSLAMTVRSRSRLPLIAAMAAPLIEWTGGARKLNPLAWTGLCLADDLAYAAGVHLGAARSRSLVALTPRMPHQLIERPRASGARAPGFDYGNERSRAGERTESSASQREPRSDGHFPTQPRSGATAAATGSRFHGRMEDGTDE